MKTLKARPRLRRADAFLGVHFDFHAGADCLEVGKTVTPRMIGRMLDLIRPDYVQCDCKGHPGIASYPTKVGTPAPGFVKDPLAIWRRETAKRGIALFMHYSGIWDDAALRLHPEWATVDEKGTPSTQKTSVFGPYADQLLIPQIFELWEKYKIDGVWVDGECWATVRDYSPQAIAAYCKQTGQTQIPRQPEDPGFLNYVDFCREGFRNYLRHWVDVLHAQAPGIQLCSNWAFTSQMPEPVSANLDFLSGDYSPSDSYNSARFEARCLALQGKSWDLMAWSFGTNWGSQGTSTKSALQLQQEAAAVLALGGGFQTYFTQKRDGAIREWQVPIMAKVAAFCRARQFLHQSTPVAQVALLYSSAAYYADPRGLFGHHSDIQGPLQGILQCLLDCQQVVDITMDHHLRARLQQYPLVVVPEWAIIADDLRQQLLAYVKAGGRLLLLGPDSADLFAKELGLAWEGPVTEHVRWIEHQGLLASVHGRIRKASLSKGSRQMGRLFVSDDMAGESIPAAVIKKVGQGQIAASFFEMGRQYRNRSSHGHREFLSAMLQQLFPKPIVEVTGSHMVDVTLQQKQGRLLVSLINTAGLHSNPKFFSFDEIPPLHSLTVRLRLPSKPKQILQQPEGKTVKFTYAQGVATVDLPRLDIHTILQITPGASPVK